MPIPLVTRILVADDHPIVRSGLRRLLNSKPDLEVVAEAENGAEAVEEQWPRTSISPSWTSRCQDDRDSGRCPTAQAQTRTHAC